MAQALLGESKSLYPELPEASEFRQLRLYVGSVCIAKEAHDLLYIGAVRTSRSDVCQGEREAQSLSAALQIRLFHTLSAGTQTMI